LPPENLTLKYSDGTIGMEFLGGGKCWCCTQLGIRTVKIV
jgi:hypothetical protein